MENYTSDEERVEALKKWWKENGLSLFLGVAVGLGAVFGWRAWSDYKDAEAEAAAITTVTMVNSISREKPEKIEAHGQTIIKEYGSTPYAVTAAMAMARVSVDKGDLPKAEKQLQQALALASDANLKHIARLRLVRVMIAQKKHDAAMALINSVAHGSFSAAYEEQRGNIQLLQGKRQQALASYRKAMAALPKTARMRAILKLKIEDLAVSHKGG